MKDILIPKSIESPDGQDKISFNTISTDDSGKNIHDTCIVSPKSVNFDEQVEEVLIPSSDVDFGSVTYKDENTSEIIIPEDVIFDASEPSIEHIVHHIKAEYRDYYKGTSFRWTGTWEVNKLYTSDEYFVDYVEYGNAVYVCIKSHFSTTVPADSPQYWQKLVEGNFGKDGNNAIHVGPIPPTKEEYGDYFENIIWIDTSVGEQDNLQVYSKEEVDNIINCLKDELDISTEEWIFTLVDGSTITKNIVVRCSEKM